MAIQPTLLLIADIAGYTRFMRYHRASLAHAQDIVARLLEAVIDASEPHLTLAKLEGDAAFFYQSFSRQGAASSLDFLGERAAAIYQAFHRRASDLSVNRLCQCDACKQTGGLKIKLVGHFGEAAVQKVKHLTELAGVDVILVHRMLKNDVPVPEYLLMTRPLHERVGDALRDHAAPHALELDDLGATEAFYLDLERHVGALEPSPRLGMATRVARQLQMAGRSLPELLGLRQACADFRNLPSTR